MRGLKWAAAFACLLGAIPVFAQDGFSYQGVLQSAGAPVDGTADVQISLWDSAAGGVQLGLTQTVTGVTVAKGAFTLVLNDAAQIGAWSLFSGAPRWLELKFRAPSGVGSYVTVAPRTRMSGAPFSQATRGMTVDSAGFIGFGSPSPTHFFEVQAPNPTPGHNGNSISLTASYGYSLDFAGAVGGAVSVNAGPGGSMSKQGGVAGDGGSITLTAGTGGHGDAIPSTAGKGGDITLLAGEGGFVSNPFTGGPSAPGNIYLSSGWAPDHQYPGAGNIFAAGAVQVDAVNSRRLEIFRTAFSLEATDSQGILRLNSTSTSASFLDLHSQNASATTLGAVRGLNSVGTVANQISLQADGQIWFQNSGQLHMVLNNSGNLGIGTIIVPNILTLPNVAGVGGRGLANRWDTYSSERFKEHVRPIPNAIETLLRLQGVSFDWKADYGASGDLGFIAERVAEVLPGLVSLDAEGKPLSMDYAHIVPLTVEAIKQEHAQHASEMKHLQHENDELRARLEAIEKKLLAMEH